MSEIQTGTGQIQKSKAEAKAAYDKMSHWYDVLAGSSEQGFVRLGLEKLGAAEGEVMLEIGFGIGHALVALAQAVGDSGKVYGIDICRPIFVRKVLEEAGFQVIDSELRSMWGYPSRSWWRRIPSTPGPQGN